MDYGRIRVVCGLFVQEGQNVAWTSFVADSCRISNHETTFLLANITQQLDAVKSTDVWVVPLIGFFSRMVIFVSKSEKIV